MSKRKTRRKEYVPTAVEQARDELFSHILRCGVLEAADEQRKEWFDDTMEYLAERYEDLTPEPAAGAADAGGAVLPAGRGPQGRRRGRRGLTHRFDRHALRPGDVTIPGRFVSASGSRPRAARPPHTDFHERPARPAGRVLHAHDQQHVRRDPAGRPAAPSGRRHRRRRGPGASGDRAGSGRRSRRARPRRRRPGIPRRPRPASGCGRASRKPMPPPAPPKKGREATASGLDLQLPARPAPAAGGRHRPQTTARRPAAPG